MIEKLKEIEERFKVNEIKWNNIELWPVIRTAFYVKYSNVHNGYSWASQNRPKPSFWVKLRQVFQSWRLIRFRNDFIFISESNEVINIDNKGYDKLFSPIIENLNSKHCLIIEQEIPNIKSTLKKKHRTSPLYLISIGAKLLPIGKIKIEGEDVLIELLEYSGISIDYRKIAKVFINSIRIGSRLFKFWRTKVLFVKCFYSPINQGLIYSANKMGIKTFEVQHGLISGNHPSYNVFTVMQQITFPDTLLSYGNKEVELYANSKYKVYNEVIPIGNFNLERVAKMVDVDGVQGYSEGEFSSVGLVTTQVTIEKELLLFLEPIFVNNPEILFLIKPRESNLTLEGLKINRNVRVVNTSFYHLIKSVDFHVTCYSTCAIEAPFFGVPNILININNLSVEYFKDILEPSKLNYYINNPEEFKDAFLKASRVFKNFKTKINSDNIIPNYHERIKKIIKDEC